MRLWFQEGSPMMQEIPVQCPLSCSELSPHEIAVPLLTYFPTWNALFLLLKAQLKFNLFFEIFWKFCLGIFFFSSYNISPITYFLYYSPSSLASAAAAAAAKSLQSCPTLCGPIDGSPLGSPVPGILQARALKWVAISFSNAWKWKVKVKSLSRVRLLATPWAAAHQAPPSMGFPRQEYWSGVPLPSLTVILM